MRGQGRSPRGVQCEGALPGDATPRPDGAPHAGCTLTPGWSERDVLACAVQTSVSARYQREGSGRGRPQRGRRRTCPGGLLLSHLRTALNSLGPRHLQVTARSPLPLYREGAALGNPSRPCHRHADSGAQRPGLRPPGPQQGKGNPEPGGPQRSPRPRPREARQGGLEGPRKPEREFRQVRPGWHPDATFGRSRSKLKKHLD